MLYDSYQKKILRVLDVLRKIFKHIVLISIVSALVLAAIITFMATKGIVLDDKSVADSFEVTYGDNLPINAKAMFARVTYEYSTDGVEWSVNAPRKLGQYMVRATAKTLFGQTKYGKVYSFALNAKSIDVSVVDKKITYGVNPNVKAELAFDDKLVCEQFIYEDRLASITNVIATKDAIRILDSNGEDVTASYSITPIASQITVMPRPIYITVSDKELIYNDTKLSYDGYELTNGTLAEGDTLQAVFNKYLIDVGEIKNTPEIRVVAHDGLDITCHYDISTQIGTLKVDYRPLIIKTGSAEKVYDDVECFNNTYEIIGEYDLVEGHVANCDTYPSIVDVDEVENSLVISIKNTEGEDKTYNYSLFYERGTIKVTPRPVSIFSESGTWVYDGAQHDANVTLNNFVSGHRVSATSPSIIDVGTVENRVEINRVFDSNNRDVMSNYEFIYEQVGTLTVTKRPITITHENSPANLVYDGTERVFANYQITEGSLAENDTIELTLPSFSQAGRYENGNKIIQAIIYSQRMYGEKTLDAFTNYEITEIYGTIEIAKRKITIQIADNEKVYDGLEFYAVKYNLVEGELPVNHTLNVVFKHISADVGEYDAEIDLEKTNITYIDVEATQNFEINAINGKLTIIPRSITLQDESIDRVYDGKNFASTHIAIVSGSLAEGHEIANVSVILKDDNSEKAENVIEKYISAIDKSTLIIRDSNKVDVTKNYDITCLDGIVQILLRKLSVTSNSETKVYDRTALSGKEVTVDPISVTNDGLLEGHKLIYTLPTSEINVGAYNNEIVGLDIVDDLGISVKHFYDITTNIGILNILPIEITVTTESAEKIYDGKELSHLVYSTDADVKLLEGDRITIQVIGKIINAGVTPNDIECVIYDADGNDITEQGYYKLNCNYGNLTVHCRQILIRPLPDKIEKLYDGTPLECFEYLDISDVTKKEGLIENHQLSELHFASITDAGSIAIEVDSEKGFKIVSGELDVSSNYEIVIEGDQTLTVAKRKITVVSDSAKKEYDGRPLVAPNCKWSPDSEHTLLEGHSLYLIASGIQTVEGISNNIIDMDAKILDADDNDYAKNYDITYIEGELEVYKIVVAKVTSTKGGFIYLRVKAYGDYNGKGFDESPSATNYFNYRTESQCNFNFWTSVILSRSGYSMNTLTVTEATQYMLPYYMTFGGNYTMPVYNTEDYGAISSTSSYTVPYYDYSYEKNGTSGLNRYSVSQSSSYTSWVKNNYLDIPTTTKNNILAYVEEYGLATLNTEEKIKEVAAFVRGSALYNTDYPAELDRQSDIATAFFTEYKEGSARHFAIAATMLYRALGIPARYVEGYLVKTEANEQTDVKDAHCWVEVFLDYYGWMQIEVVGVETHKIEIILKPKDEEKPYDGNPLEAKEVEFYQVSDDIIELFEINKYKISAKFSGSITDVGKTISRITELQIYDANGNNITYRFDIKTVTGDLTVTPIPINVLLSNLSKTYDGLPATYLDNDKFYSVRDDKFKEKGYTLTLSANFIETNVYKLSAADINNEIDAYISFTVMDGEKDISKNFYINLVSYSEDVAVEDYIVVEIKQRPIEISSASQTKYYIEGAKLVNNKVSVTRGSLVENHKLFAVANGVLEAVGSIENPIDTESVKIADSEGNNVTRNYKITIKYGVLTFIE